MNPNTFLQYLIDHGPILTVREVRLLGAVIALPGRSVRELASELRLVKPAITRATDRLVEEGLLSRVQDTNDRLWTDALRAAAREQKAAA